MSLAPSTRRYDLDWLRVIAFGLLIFYHVGMFYVTWDFHVKSTHAGPFAEPLMRLLNPWRLSLLFFISGVAMRFAGDKLGHSRFLRTRFGRLGLPILFGIVVVVAPQSWLELVEKGEFTGSFWAFYPQYLDFGSKFSVITPTWNHLWYVVYLLVYSILLIPMVGPLARFMAGRGAQITQSLFGGRFGVLAAIAIPLAPHILYRLTLDPHFPTTHNLVADWANHAHSLTMLLFGFVLAKDQAFWGAVRRGLWPILTLAILLAAMLTPIWSNWDFFAAEDSPYAWALWPARMARIAYAWIMILALLGLAQRYLNRSSRALTYATEAVFPWYILHQTIIIMAGFWLTRQGLGAGTEFALVTLATVAGSVLITHFIIRPVGFLRPLFGLKGLASKAQRKPAETAA